MYSVPMRRPLSGFRPRFLAVPLLLACWTGLVHPLTAETPLPARFQISQMKTLFLGMTLTLTTGTFKLDGDVYRANYATTVSPLSSEDESGIVTLKASQADYERLRRGESIKITGQAKTTVGELRRITVFCQPSDQTQGKAKVRISYGIFTLEFHGAYRTSGPG